MSVITIARWFFGGLMIFAIDGCNDNNPSLIIPDLSLDTNDFFEGDSDMKAELIFKLSEKVNTAITYSYTMQDETALNDLDYKAGDGTIVFESGTTETTLKVDLVSDTFMELRESFSITIVSDELPEKSFSFQVFILDDDTEYEISEDAEGYITPDEYPSMRLVWSDEFDGTGLDTENWTYEIGNGCDKGICGWGNEELEVYTDSEENVYTENGKLVIKATGSSPGTYRSGRLITDNKQEFQFGRIDIRAKLPVGQGIWPAIWMLGSNIDDVGWPQCGEIDIMEYLGQQPDVVHGTVHYDYLGYKSSTGSYILDGNRTFDEKFHVFSILWDRNKIIWFVDYTPFKTITNKMIDNTGIFNRPFYFIMNVAVGGLWPGAPDETTEFPQQMEVDYIRVFQ